MPIEVLHVGAHLEPVVARKRLRIDPRPGDDNHPQRRHPLLRLRERGDHPPQQVAADARAADGDDADLLLVAVAELGSEGCPVGELCRIEARDVAREGVVLLGPVRIQGRWDANRSGTMSSIADEDGPVAHAREPRDVLDHLLVVVAG